MPNLTGYAPLDIAIGLGFVYLLFSVLCSAVQEAIAGVREWRAKTLEEALRNLLEDDGAKGKMGAPDAVAPVDTTAVTAPSAPPADSVSAAQGKRDGTLEERVLSHGLIRPLYKEGRKPSYLNPKLFALALLDIAAPGQNGDPIEAISKQIALADIPNGVKDALLGLTKGAAKDRDHLRSLVEDWFNGSMERVSGWYKRKAQLVICALSLAVTIGANINTIGIGETLAKDNAVRAAVVAQAEKTTIKEGAKPKEAATAIAEVQQLGIPIGWSKSGKDPAQANFESAGAIARTVGGWLLTFIALSLGAPFWFGVLGKLTSLRTSGNAPTTKPATTG
jgi:hypothetical protein